MSHRVAENGFSVVIVTDHAVINGGVSQVAVQSARILSDSGIAVTFAFGVGPADASIADGRMTLIDMHLHDLLTNPSRAIAAATGIWNLTAAGQLTNVLNAMDRRRTIVHFHGWMKSLSPSVIHTALASGFPVVVTLHDYFIACPNGGLFDYQEGAPCRLAPMSMACITAHCDARSYPQKLWRVVRQSVQRQIAGIPDRLAHFISVSDFSENILRPYLPQGACIHRVTNPIDVEKANPARPGSNSPFSFVGRLSPEKGPALFAQASRRAGIHAQFLGDGEAREQVQSLNPAASIHGWCSRDTVRAHLMASRAVVFPSLWYETQGMVTLEAAALGIPCIVSDACASRDYVEDGVTGLWFRSGDAGSLVEKLRFLDGNSDVANTMGLEAHRRYWAVPHDQQRHLRELLACYESILSRA